MHPDPHQDSVDGDQDSVDVRLERAVSRTEGLQLGRRVFHALNGIVLAAVLNWLGPYPGLALRVFGVLVALLLIADVLRLTIPRLNLLFFRVFRWFASPREHARIASSTWYLVGVLLLVAFFPVGTWVPAVLVLALADPSASYAGRRFGKRRLGGGTVVGSSAFFLVTFGVLVWFCPFGLALAAALMVTAVEALPRFVVDDNVTVPLAVAGAMWLLNCV